MESTTFWPRIWRFHAKVALNHNLPLHPSCSKSSCPYADMTMVKWTGNERHRIHLYSFFWKSRSAPGVFVSDNQKGTLNCFFSDYLTGHLSPIAPPGLSSMALCEESADRRDTAQHRKPSPQTTGKGNHTGFAMTIGQDTCLPYSAQLMWGEGKEQWQTL